MTRNRLAKGVLLSLLTILAITCTTAPKADYPAAPVPFTDVHLTDAFWAPRLETNRTVTIPHNFKQSEETGRVKNFELAAAALDGATDGKFCSRYPFDDSDVYKVIEAASYALATHARSRAREVRRRAHRQDRRRPGAGRLPLHRPDDRRPAASDLAGQGALVEPLHEPRALQPRAPLRSGRRPLPGDGQEEPPGHRRQERRPRRPRVRPGQAHQSRPATRRSRSAWSSSTASPARGSTSTWPSSSSTPAARPKAASPIENPAKARSSSSTASTPRTTSPSSSRPRPSATPSGPATSTPARPTSPP